MGPVQAYIFFMGHDRMGEQNWERCQNSDSIYIYIKNLATNLATFLSRHEWLNLTS